jgi:hypothetical protein
MGMKEILMTITTTPPAPTLAVLPISATEWRVGDPRRRSDDALCLMGFVQQLGEVFEVTCIGMPLTRAYYSSLDEAVAALATPHG